MYLWIEERMGLIGQRSDNTEIPKTSSRGAIAETDGDQAGLACFPRLLATDPNPAFAHIQITGANFL